eukprot:gnl/TRDRNA2_/TRDRNA2_83332_c0_seq1.p1 gnl/TRDRNA2_/TRDRNA2_83332_c0~~gnl/TRDRNA2_/TRDRNA2_83332_c0_seq1.p1  ORF type:complete len:455 (+),score=51.79 gnl/TRDRNA2_/TRDRNA2_83332_c0_seq1:63-1367(+)
MASDGAVSKKGMELFRTLLRIYPTAEVEDYYRGGVWREDLIRMDLTIMEAHRRQAGSLEAAPPIEEVPTPELPGPQTNGALSPFGAVTAIANPLLAPRPVLGAASDEGPEAEMRLLALFVSKWKLEPARTKELLAELTPAHKRFVIQNFKTLNPGPEATKSLEQFIAQCERTGTWDRSPKPLSATVGAGALKAPAPSSLFTASALLARSRQLVGARPPLTGTITGRPATAGVPAKLGSGLVRPLTGTSFGILKKPWTALTGESLAERVAAAKDRVYVAKDVAAKAAAAKATTAAIAKTVSSAVAAKFAPAKASTLGAAPWRPRPFGGSVLRPVDAGYKRPVSALLGAVSPSDPSKRLAVGQGTRPLVGRPPGYAGAVPGSKSAPAAGAVPGSKSAPTARPPYKAPPPSLLTGKGSFGWPRPPTAGKGSVGGKAW